MGLQSRKSLTLFRQEGAIASANLSWSGRNGTENDRNQGATQEEE